MVIQNQRVMLIMGQAFMVVLALVLAVAPRLYLPAIVAYFVVVFGLSLYRSRSVSQGTSREEIESARTLLREDKALDVAVEDDEYIKEVSRQAKAMMLPLLLFPLYIVIFRAAPALQPRIHELIYGSTDVGDPRLSGFVTWLLVFETLFVLNQAVRRITAGDAKPVPVVPGAYRVTDKGIVFKGGLGRVIAFPFPEGTKITLNETRGFVEIEMPQGMRIRLYTKKPRRLYEILQRYGGVEGGHGDKFKSSAQ